MSLQWVHVISHQVCSDAKKWISVAGLNVSLQECFWPLSVYLNPKMTSNERAWILSVDDPWLISPLIDLPVIFTVSQLISLCSVKKKMWKMLIMISQTPWNCFFCPTYSPKLKDSSFIIMNVKEKQRILQFWEGWPTKCLSSLLEK